MVTTDDLPSVLLHIHKSDFAKDILHKYVCYQGRDFKSRIICDTKPRNLQMGTNISEELLP